jgi:hypothetical protein
MADQYYGESDLATWTAKQQLASANRDNEKLRTDRDRLRIALASMLALFGRPKEAEYVDGGASYKLACETVAAALAALGRDAPKGKPS